jgi:hypothetical protein
MIPPEEAALAWREPGWFDALDPGILPDPARRRAKGATFARRSPRPAAGMSARLENGSRERIRYW